MEAWVNEQISFRQSVLDKSSEYLVSNGKRVKARTTACKDIDMTRHWKEIMESEIAELARALKETGPIGPRPVFSEATREQFGNESWAYYKKVEALGYNLDSKKAHFTKELIFSTDHLHVLNYNDLFQSQVAREFNESLQRKGLLTEEQCHTKSRKWVLSQYPYSFADHLYFSVRGGIEGHYHNTARMCDRIIIGSENDHKRFLIQSILTTKILIGALSGKDQTSSTFRVSKTDEILEEKLSNRKELVGETFKAAKPLMEKGKRIQLSELQVECDGEWNNILLETHIIAIGFPAIAAEINGIAVEFTKLQKRDSAAKIMKTMTQVAKSGGIMPNHMDLNEFLRFNSVIGSSPSLTTALEDMTRDAKDEEDARKAKARAYDLGLMNL